MTDDQRPDLEWPSEDLARTSRPPEPKPEVEWPSEDVAKTAQAKPVPPAPAPTPAPQPSHVEPSPAPQPAEPTPELTPASPAPQPAEPPAYEPPTYEPPQEQPPLTPQSEAPPEPPAYQPPEPPAYQPPEPPAYQPPEPPAYQPPEPVAPQPPDDPYDLPRAGSEQGGYVPPPEYQQLPTENPFTQQPRDDEPRAADQEPSPYGDQQAYGQPPAYGQPTAYGQPPYGQPPYADPSAAGAPYQNQYADPSQTVAPGPYAGAGVPPTPVQTEDSAEEGKRYFRKDIEGLRAIAVLAVVLFHVGVPFFDGGFVGVDVFYVISGFLITGLLLREGEATGKVDLLHFYARRMRRLLPAALLVIVVTLALSAFIVSPLRLAEIAGDAAASALYVANFRFGLEATDYLATVDPSPLLHFWSLGVEEQFYLFWPLILLAFVRFLPGRSVGLVVLLLAIASFALSFVWTWTLPEWAFFSPFTRAWELAAGALIAVGLLRIPQRLPRSLGAIAVVVGLLLIAAAVLMGGILDELGFGNPEVVNAIFPTLDSPYPGIAALLPVLGAVLVIIGGSHSRTLVGRFVLGNPVSRYFGRISYSLYLWHWPLIILIPIELGVDELSTRLALAGVAVVLAILSTELWERPWRRSGTLERRSGGTFRLGLVGSVGVGAVALYMSGAIVLPSNIELPWIQPPKVVAELNGVRDDLPASYADECHLKGYGRARLTTDCVYGDPEGEQTAMLIGDSHAAQWLPAIDAYAREKGWRLENFTKAACPVIDVPVWERSQHSIFEACINWRTKVLKHVRETKPDVVYVGLSRDYELWSGEGVIPSSTVAPYWRERLTDYLTTLSRPAGEVVLLAETPFLPYDPVNCLADEDIASCDPSTRRVVDADYAALEQQAATDAGAELLSINQLLCDEATCPVMVDDDVVFRDNHHLTASYMARLAEPIGNLLEGRPAYPTPAPTLPSSVTADGA